MLEAKLALDASLTNIKFNNVIFTIFLDYLSARWLVLAAIGLARTFGVVGVINMASW